MKPFGLLHLKRQISIRPDAKLAAKKSAHYLMFHSTLGKPAEHVRELFLPRAVGAGPAGVRERGRRGTQRRGAAPPLLLRRGADGGRGPSGGEK